MQIWKFAYTFVLHEHKYAEDFTLQHLLHFEICACEICQMLVYKHSETECIKNFKKAYFLRNLQTSRINNSRILKIRNAKFSGYGFYMNTNIQLDFQICISVMISFTRWTTAWSIEYCSWKPNSFLYKPFPNLLNCSFSKCLPLRG